MSQNSPHIVIIGGGVIGTSIAYHLAKKGTRVTLIEARDLASGSSGACDGLVFMQSKKPGIHLRLAMESLKRAMLGGQSFEGKQVNVNQATKMLRTFTAQIEALKKYRTGGQQKMTVEHVHVNEGGQAIVGTVIQGGGGKNDE